VGKQTKGGEGSFGLHPGVMGRPVGISSVQQCSTSCLGKVISISSWVGGPDLKVSTS